MDSEGQESQIAVWYINDYTFSAAFIEANAMLSFKGFNGLPVYYETVKSINYGGNEISIIRVYQILEIKKNLKIETKEFNIPEGYVIKTYAEWIKDNPSGLLK
ncbi:hypothetical protein [Ferruginibacter sp.]|nr:hypothetical protein [Ferruginibacter sp.]